MHREYTAQSPFPPQGNQGIGTLMCEVTWLVLSGGVSET